MTKTVELAKVNISELSTALSLANCQRQYTEVMGYLQALLECKAITSDEFRSFSNDANAGLASWKEPPMDIFGPRDA